MIYEETDYTMFYYDIDELLNTVSTYTLINTRHSKNEAGESNTDDISLTNDESALFNKLLKKGGLEIFERVSVLSKTITDAFLFDTSDDESTSISEAGLLIYKVVLPTQWDDNISKLLDENIESALISYVIKEWFRINGIMDRYQVENENYKTLLSKIKGNVVYRKKNVKITYRGF